jgi:hypothetical protein
VLFSKTKSFSMVARLHTTPPYVFGVVALFSGIEVTSHAIMCVVQWFVCFRYFGIEHELHL